MSHQMLDSLKGYLDNITAAAMHTAATGTPLAEFASLAVSVDTVARQLIEIKLLTEHINALIKKGGAVTAGVPNTGENNSPNCKHCAAVGLSAPRRHNQCFFTHARTITGWVGQRSLWREKESSLIMHDI